MGCARRAVALRTGTLVLAIAGNANATPQISAGADFGVVEQNIGASTDTHTRLNLGLRVEGLFLREGPTDFGLGPFVQTRTAWFHGADYGGGLVALFPIDRTFPLWVNAGPFARRDSDRWAPGAQASIGFGSRSFNYGGPYAMTYAITLDAREHFGDERGLDVVAGITIDLEAYLLPVLLVGGAL